MMRFIIFSFVLFTYTQLLGQTTGSNYKIGDSFRQSLLLEVGTAYIPENNELANPDLFNVRTGRPSTVNIYFFKPMEIAGKYFMFKPGIGLGLDNFFFEQNLRFEPSGDTVRIDEGSNRSYRKSKLSANYVDIPLEFRLATSSNSKKAFKFEFGGKIGILFEGHSKRKYDVNDITIKEKASDLALRRFRYGLTGRIGYGRLILFTYYSLSPIFKEEFMPDINPVIFGITLSSL